jgi:hypothetical protein
MARRVSTHDRPFTPASRFVGSATAQLGDLRDDAARGLQWRAFTI